MGKSDADDRWTRPLADQRTSRHSGRARPRLYSESIETSELVRRCLTAIRICETECKRGLAADPLFSTESGPLSVNLITLLACEDACRVTLKAIELSDDQLVHVCQWCADLCQVCGQLARMAGLRWAAIAAACEQCEVHCSDLALKLTGRDSANGCEHATVGED